jgi:hypothetical protein
MNVITYAAHSQQNTTLVFYNSAKITVKVFAPIVGNQRHSVFGAENQVMMQTSVGRWHIVTLFSELYSIFNSLPEVRFAHHWLPHQRILDAQTRI